MDQLTNSIEALDSIYKNRGLDLNEDLDYLINAYHEIHQLWIKNLKRIDKVNLTVLGEAPLWGTKKSYIYNPDTKNTQFFHRKDLEPILRFTPANKDEFLNGLTDLGILILDVSPFALNDTDTQLSYRTLKPSEYRGLVDSCWKEHIQPVLMRISDSSPNFVFRYKRVRDIFEPLFVEKLNLASIGSIHQGGGGINRKKLLEYYENRS